MTPQSVTPFAKGLIDSQNSMTTASDHGDRTDVLSSDDEFMIMCQNISILHYYIVIITQRRPCS